VLNAAQNYLKYLMNNAKKDDGIIACVLGSENCDQNKEYAGLNLMRKHGIGVKNMQGQLIVPCLILKFEVFLRLMQRIHCKK